MPARNSDGTIRNPRTPKVLKPRSVRARWVEAETVRRKQMGLPWHAIAEQISRVGRGEEQPLVAFPPGIHFTKNYSITLRAVAYAFQAGMTRLPNMEVENMRRIDTERCEDIYRGLVPGIMRGEPASGSTAVKALEHKSRINGYSGQENQLGSAMAFQININLGGSNDG